VLVFFGYTHCPDVCPATIGEVGLAMGASPPGIRALFVSIDPERDTPAWLKEYVGYLRDGFTGLTGTANQVRVAAAAWGVKYARVDTGDPAAYSMSHTADVFLVDPDGRLRARFPFGTEGPTIAAVLRDVLANPVPAQPTAAVASPTPVATRPPAGVWPKVVSTSVWSGRSPVVLALHDGAGWMRDPSLEVTVQLLDAAGEPVGPPVAAATVQPPGIETVSVVATLDIPAPGEWGLSVRVATGGTTLSGWVDVTTLDPGTTASIGGAAPGIATPTLDDVAGVARAVTTDPLPDLRLSRTSTAQALAAHQPFVLVVDSPRFKVSPACGRAVILARTLLDRWTDVTFIHHEPYRYALVTDTPRLEGSLQAPVLTDVAVAWGIQSAPWGALSMPWIFVVDGDGIVRAKYQGVVGTEDVDVMLALIAAEAGARVGRG
jgi:protein SCO1/2